MMDNSSQGTAEAPIIHLVAQSVMRKAGDGTEKLFLYDAFGNPVAEYNPRHAGRYDAVSEGGFFGGSLGIWDFRKRKPSGLV